MQSPDKRDFRNPQNFNDWVAEELANTLTIATIENRLPDLVYIVITRTHEGKPRIFTAPYEMNYDEPAPAQSVARPQKLEDTGILHEHIPLTVHLQAVVTHNPTIGIVMDNATSAALVKSNPKLTLIDNGNNHCMLMGLRKTPVDIYLTGDHFQIRSNPSVFI